MAFLRTYSAQVREANINAGKWHSRVASSRKKYASEVLAAYSPEKWLLSHVSIMASVDVEPDDPKDPKKNWRIIPEHSHLVNNNGDAWERELLKKTYRTFLGANNYVEHCQLTQLSKGKVIDVALREVDLGKKIDGTPCTTLYVDLLIATSWEHDDLCKKILSGEFNATSMGCKIAFSQCTKCGNIAKDEVELCEHVRFEKRNTYFDREGKPRIVAELCGSSDDPSSVVFIDASWVRNPAFPGAVLRNILNPTPPVSGPVTPVVANPVSVPVGQAPVKEAPKDTLMESLRPRVTTDTEHHAIAKAAASKKAADEPAPEAPALDAAPADPSADERFGLEGDKPADDTAFPDAAPVGDAPAGDASADADPLAGADKPVEDEPTDPEVAAATPLDQIKKEVMDSLMGQIKQDLMDSAKKMMGPEELPDPASTYGDISYDNLAKEASYAVSKEACYKLWSKYSIDVQMVHDRRLAGGLLLAATGPMTRLASFGYTRNDMLRLLAYLDRRAGSDALNDTTVKFLGLTKTASDKVAFFRDLMIVTGREPSKQEARKALAWVSLLENFR